MDMIGHAINGQHFRFPVLDKGGNIFVYFFLMG